MAGLVNNEMEGMRKEVVVAQFEAPSWHLPGRTEKHDIRIFGAPVGIRNRHLGIHIRVVTI
jgi:hypothetical protein